MAIRHASKNLVFLDLQSDGHTVQVLSEVKHFRGSRDEATGAGAGGSDNNTIDEAVKSEFRALHESLRRGDIIGVTGFPGKSGKGELSIVPRQLQVLAPCLQPFPNSKYGIKEPVSKGDRATMRACGDRCKLMVAGGWMCGRKSASARSTWTC